MHMIYKTFITRKVWKIIWLYALRNLLLRFEQNGAFYHSKPRLNQPEKFTT